ncbi:sensor histidine kinase [Paenibacillus sp. 481]|uniref:sensor histidine kinase n=1 Tax=Paenibacillus sp. 481 TaxID=2835869 RepID=UPI001E58758A|nr:ATP-binding protein [Paenibacillus sp. 481]UHA75099.1 HAMP domain-containing protein [Paenibacillus sp. 481]
MRNHNRLSVRWTWILFSLTACILLMVTVIVVSSIHMHVEMFQAEHAPISDVHMTDNWGKHLEQAIVESILWTLLGALLLAIIVSMYVARKISAPLVEMKRVAESMARGKYAARIAHHHTDAGELGQLSQAINHLAARLEQQEQLRVSMTDNIAHELRTPLTTLKSHMLALRDGVWEATPSRIASCYEEIERLAGLVDDLQELNELKQPEFGLSFSEVKLDELVQESIQLMEAAYYEKGVAISAHLASDVHMKGDPQRLKQVLLNLLSNALKFTPASAGQVHVLVQDNVEHIEIIVEDNGIGIAADDIPFLFERFYRADKARGRSTGGSGIGLSIVQTIVEAHGGEVWAESGAQGSRIHVQFVKEKL